MKEMEQAKKTYDSIPVPEELKETMEQMLEADQKHRNQQEAMRRRRQRRLRRCLVGAAAAFALCLMTALNTVESFAASAAEIPVVGRIAKVLTFREYAYEDEDKEVKVSIPEIQVEETADSASDVQTEEAQAEEEPETVVIDAETVNQAIQEKVDAFVKESEQEIADYKEAFLATGGTEEEFAQHDLGVEVSYDVKYEEGPVVSFVVTGYRKWTGSGAMYLYYNLDLAKGTELTLQDLLGENYQETADSQIRAQMEERMAADPNVVYWGEEMDGFSGVNEETNFYLNEDGNPVVVFEKYEIGPGSIGVQEFEICPE